MKAGELMTRDVRTCSADDSLERAAHVMWTHDVGCLVVIDGDRRPVGMITDRDIAMAAYIQGVRLLDAHVASAMASRVVTCSPSTSLVELENIMRSSQIRRVPVVDSSGELVGIVALGDIARSAQSSPLKVAESPGLARTLAGITARRSAQATAAE